MSKSLKGILMVKCDFIKVVLQLYWNHTSAWVFSCKFAAFFSEHLLLWAISIGLLVTDSQIFEKPEGISF